MSTNPWIKHLKKYHADHSNLSYKEAMIAAKPSYKSAGKQRGKGAFAGEAAAAAQVVGVAGDVSKSAIGAIQTDKANSGRYDKARFDKRTREFGRLKRKMEKGKFPQMYPK